MAGVSAVDHEAATARLVRLPAMDALIGTRCQIPYRKCRLILPPVRVDCPQPAVDGLSMWGVLNGRWVDSPCV